MSGYVQSLLGILLSAVLTENFILVKFYGICPFMGVSKKIDTALGMGMAVTFVMALASAATWAVNAFLLVPFGLEYMQTVAFILVIAAGGAFTDLCLPFQHCLCVGAAAGIAAAAAVGAGQAFIELIQPGIGLYIKQFGCGSQHQSEHQSQTGEDAYCNQNLKHIAVLLRRSAGRRSP